MKTVLLFLGPQHHFQLLSPMTEELRKRGWRCVYYTADAEAAFEVGLYRDLIEDWYYLPLFQDREAGRKIYTRGRDYLRTVIAEPNPVTLEPVPVLDRILRDVACDATATPNLLRHIKPDVCLALHELNRWGMLLGYTCATMGIPILTFQEGLYYGDPWIYTGHTRYSTSIVWGEATKQILIRAGCPSNRVEVIGHPDLRTRADAARNLGATVLSKLPPSFTGKKLFFWFFTPVSVNEMPIETIVRGLKESDWRVVLKMHHLSALPNIQKMKALIAACPETIYFVEDYADLWPFMVASDMVGVCGCSTLGLEALYCGKPLVEFFAPGQPMSFAKAGLAHNYLDAENGVAIPTPLLTNIHQTLEMWRKPETVKTVKAWVDDQIAHPAAVRWIADRIEKAAITKR